ncbi:glycosyltransferase family 4 protein [Candidatus Uhrbacteria bacterium]|nr:glycosyltransferase family 4 protein [Candidatus Uhrbacteria bacterium]
MKRLGIDARGIDTGPGAGIAHATRELVDALQESAPSFGVELVVYREVMSGSQLSSRLMRDRLDHIFVPSGAVSPFIGGYVYPWVHDLAIFRHPEWFPQSFWKRLLTTRLFLKGLRRAKHIFAVSEDTKKEIEWIAGIDGPRVTVTHQGIQRSSDVARDEVQGSEKYALILGTVEPRKNIAFIDELWGDVRRRFPNARLVVAGRDGWGNVSTKNAERVENVSDAERDRLIANASMLLLPSLHEGFGRTALEAMSHGIPVIASNKGAIPEVVGKAGVLLQPSDREGWIRAITDGFEGRIDGQAGKEQVKRFSWKNTARIILAKIVETW